VNIHKVPGLAESVPLPTWQMNHLDSLKSCKLPSNFLSCKLSSKFLNLESSVPLDSGCLVLWRSCLCD
jgi:hypothetical protein